jgi:ClpP class serine protease
MRGDTALELGLVDKLGTLDDAVNSLVAKLELEDYKVFSYENNVEFDDYLNSMAEDLLPIQIQDLMNKMNGLNRMFLAEKDRYVVVYCFDCGFRKFE